MKKPSRAMLAVFRAAAKQMESDMLLDLRLAFVCAREHPATIAAIDAELKQRVQSRRASVFDFSLLQRWRRLRQRATVLRPAATAVCVPFCVPN